LSESVLLTFFAMLIAVVIVIMLLPQFNKITGKEITFELNTDMIAGIIAITIFTGFLSGSYPALYLSLFSPIMVLKGKLRSSFGEVWARKGLVVFQFTLSIMLIVGVLVVYKQMKYIQSTNIGYNKDNIIRFNSEGKINHTETTFIAELK